MELISNMPRIAALLFTIPTLVGCACSGQMRRFDVQVSVDESVRQDGRMPPVEVHLIGVNNIDAGTLEGTSLRKYFAPHDKTRESAEKAVMTFDQPNKPQTLSIKDPIWDKWKSHGAMKLVILSSYPFEEGDKPGDSDPRRRTLPLDCANWEDSTKMLKIVVKGDGLSVETPPKATANH